MSCDVCIPWRATPERAPIFERVRAWWEGHGFHVITADSGHAVFNRAASRNLAVARATTAEVLVADADTIADIDTVHRAVGLARVAPVYPFHRYAYLPPAALHALDPAQWEPEYYVPESPGGCFAINRAHWSQLGGQDPGFTGWGFEDDAFYLVARELLQVIRLRGTVYAFAHPAPRDWSEANAGHARFERYRRAARAGDLAAFAEIRRESGALETSRT